MAIRYLKSIPCQQCNLLISDTAVWGRIFTLSPSSTLGGTTMIRKARSQVECSMTCARHLCDGFNWRPGSKQCELVLDITVNQPPIEGVLSYKASGIFMWWSDRQIYSTPNDVTTLSLLRSDIALQHRCYNIDNTRYITMLSNIATMMVWCCSSVSTTLENDIFMTLLQCFLNVVVYVAALPKYNVHTAFRTLLLQHCGNVVNDMIFNISQHFCRNMGQ